MIASKTARLSALLLAGLLAATNAPAQQTPAPAAQPAPPAAPAPPRSRGPMPDRHFDRGPMGRGRDMRGFDHGGMGGEFRIVPPGMWWKNSGLVERIGLTADQTKKMDDIFQQSRLQLVDLKANLEQQNLLLEPMLSANPIDQGKALAQIDKVAQARADLEKANARMLLGIRAVLTPDQWTKLQTGGREMGPAGRQSGPAGPGASAAPAPRGGGRGGRGMGGPPPAGPETPAAPAPPGL